MKSYLRFIRFEYLPLLILPLFVVLLQWHSIPFWRGVIGPVAGVAASLGLELVSLWRWWVPPRGAPGRAPLPGGLRLPRFRLLGLLAVSLLLAGPLYQVGSPLAAEALRLSTRERVHRSRLEDVSRELARAGRSLDRYERMAVAGAYGPRFAGKITDAERDLAAARRLKRELLRQTSGGPGGGVNASRPWQWWAKGWMYLLLLIVAQLSILLSITEISGWATPKPAPASAPKPELVPAPATAPTPESVPAPATAPMPAPAEGAPADERETAGNEAADAREAAEREAAEISAQLNMLRPRIHSLKARLGSETEIARRYDVHPDYITHALNYEQYPAPKPITRYQLIKLNKILAMEPRR